jgi:hypothetical protein
MSPELKAAFCLAVPFAAAGGFLFIPPWLLHHEAETVVSKIQQYRAEHGKLPNEIGDLGLQHSVSEKVFYSRYEDGSFCVYLGGRLGESKIVYRGN